jgi:hypothetical protein
VKGGSFLTAAILGRLESKPAPLKITRVRHPSQNRFLVAECVKIRLRSGALSGQNLTNEWRDRRRSITKMGAENVARIYRNSVGASLRAAED